MNLKALQYSSFLLTWLVLPTTLMAQPANDSCFNADTVAMNMQVFFSTLGATTDGPFHPDSPCPTSASDSIFSDIWFVHTATMTGELRWSLCGMADFDSRIAVYQPGSACPPLDSDLLDCNEDGPAACTNFESELDFDVVEGGTYLLRLGGFGAEEPGAQGTGSFILAPAPAGPPNDDCADAIDMMLGSGQMISNFDATTDGPTHPNDNVCFGFGDNTAQNDIWYTFTSPVTALIEWSTCNTVNWDSRLVVYGPNVSCADASPDYMIACSDATAGCANFTNILQFDAEEGVTYLMRVGGYAGDQGSGTFDLIEIKPPVPPDNDLCATPDTAFIITAQEADDFDFVHPGTIINSTISDNLVDPTCGDGQGGKFPDVWYKFNNLGNDTVEIRYFAEVAETGFIIEVLENCNGDTIAGNSCFRYTPTDFGVVVDTITGLSTFPTEYYVRVTGWLFWTPGPFFFQLVGDITTDTEEAAFPGQVSLAPNPVAEQLQLNLNMQAVISTEVRIVNILGETVLQKDLGLLGQGAFEGTFAMGDLSSGMYTLIVRAGGSSKALKFTKV